MMSVVDVPEHIWIEMHDSVEADACDVIVKMENGEYYTAVFVTLPYLSAADGFKLRSEQAAS